MTPCPARHGAEEPDAGVEGVSEHDVEGPGLASVDALEETPSGGHLVLPRSLGFFVEQEFKPVAHEHRANVAVVVLRPRCPVALDLSREAAVAATQVAGGGLVPIEHQGDEAMRRRGEGLVSLEAGVELVEEASDVFGVEEGLHASQGVGAGKALSSAEDAPPHAVSVPYLLQGVQAAQACEQHDEERERDGTGWGSGAGSGVDNASQPRDEAVDLFGVGQDPSEDGAPWVLRLRIFSACSMASSASRSRTAWSWSTQRRTVASRWRGT